MTNISEMTDRELSEACAIEVMGWHKDDYDLSELDITYWNPTHDLNHVWMLVEKLIIDDEYLGVHISIGQVIGKPLTEVTIEGKAFVILARTTNINSARAISEVCLMAKRSILSAI